jgi:hypothetical protein
MARLDYVLSPVLIRLRRARVQLMLLVMGEC